MNIFIVTVRMLLVAVFGTQPITSAQGLATRFGDPGDKLTGGTMSCTHRNMGANSMICAHRTLPCGTPIVVENVRNGRIAVCSVEDRGPFGAKMPNGRWHIKHNATEPGVWRGLVDLSPNVARALAFNGYEPVRLYYPTTAAKRERPLPVHKIVTPYKELKKAPASPPRIASIP